MIFIALHYFLLGCEIISSNIVRLVAQKRSVSGSVPSESVKCGSYYHPCQRNKTIFCTILFQKKKLFLFSAEMKTCCARGSNEEMLRDSSYDFIAGISAWVLQLSVQTIWRKLIPPLFFYVIIIFFGQSIVQIYLSGPPEGKEKISKQGE